MNKKSLSLFQGGFTLIEIMVVVIILSLLAGVIIPKIVDRPEDARRAKAKVQITQLGGALGMFKIDNGFYPSTDQGLDALVTKPESGDEATGYKESGYMKKIPLDPWGNQYIYLSPGEHDDFDLSSYGHDGEEGGEGKDADINNWEIE